MLGNNGKNRMKCVIIFKNKNMKYYKNGNRYTAVNGGKEFIQINSLSSVKTIKFGINRIMIGDCKEYDIEITKEQFFKKLFEIMSSYEYVLNKYA